MGLLAFVYRTPDGVDCTNGGLSSRHERMVIINVDGPFEPTDDAPACWLVPGAFPGTVKVVVHDPNGERPPRGMMGGNFLSTSDSRFSQTIEAITSRRWYGAVAIHDRFE